MKIIYSQLQKWLPDLNKPVREVANDLTILGHFADSLYEKEGEEIISLEVRQNRGDCLGYFGIAKELSVYYGIQMRSFDFAQDDELITRDDGKEKLPIEIRAKKEVKRLQAIKISGIKNKPTPVWLKKFLELHEINSINTIVDLTNYIMLWYGIPCHAFDTKKSSDHLIWELNDKKQDFITLDGTKLELEKNTFQISNDKEVVSLVMIGGKNSGIDLDTSETLIEMAIYDRVKVRLDSKGMKIVTEASIRLEKELDTQLIPMAFSNLVNLILQECGGEVTSQLFDYASEKPEIIKIDFDPKKPASYAGVDIEPEFAISILEKLGCIIKNNKVMPPTYRKDLKIEEDLIEEVIRFYGYQKIPVDQPLAIKPVPDITPKSTYLVFTIKNILQKLGYDEIRSWPLIEEKYKIKNSELPDGAEFVYTQNNINANFPVLRMSLISSLQAQKKNLERFKVNNLQLFEIGKIFYQENNKYSEQYSLGLIHFYKEKLEKDLAFLPIKPAIIKIDNYYYAEINLENLLINGFKIEKKLLNAPKNSRAAVEMTKQLISLDANIIVKENFTEIKLLEKYKTVKNLWQLELIDKWKMEKGEWKITLRAYYYNLEQKEALKLHNKIFKI